MVSATGEENRLPTLVYSDSDIGSELLTSLRLYLESRGSVPAAAWASSPERSYRTG